jgi:cephalosporin-C deacetylase
VPLYDLPVDQLRTYLPDVAEPEDFDEFWDGTLADARRHPLALEVTPVDSGLRTVEVFDVTFAGFGGQSIKAWYTRPAGVAEDLPVVVQYQGYGGGRGLAHERTLWADAGYAYLFMDTRGQGSTWGSGGDTPDPVGLGPSFPGSMTRGVLDPREYFYRRLVTDAVRAVEAARALPGVDASRTLVTGISQGGALTLAVAGLVPDLAGAMADVPFLCHVRRGVEVSPQDPYLEVAKYLGVHRDQVDQVFRTLSYVDAVNFARRATAPALVSVALMDQICPPSTVYAAVNHYGSHAAARGEQRPKVDVVEYPFNDHEGGEAHQQARQLKWAAALLGR